MSLQVPEFLPGATPLSAETSRDGIKTIEFILQILLNFLTKKIDSRGLPVTIAVYTLKGDSYCKNRTSVNEKILVPSF